MTWSIPVSEKVTLRYFLLQPHSLGLLIQPYFRVISTATSIIRYLSTAIFTMSPSTVSLLYVYLQCYFLLTFFWFQSTILPPGNICRHLPRYTYTATFSMSISKFSSIAIFHIRDIFQVHRHIIRVFPAAKWCISINAFSRSSYSQIHL